MGDNSKMNERPSNNWTLRWCLTLAGGTLGGTTDMLQNHADQMECTWNYN